MRAVDINLHRPRAALTNFPRLLFELTEAVIKLQKSVKQLEVPGLIVWLNTLRAVSHPELRARKRDVKL